jgi:hypothetical protein
MQRGNPEKYSFYTYHRVLKVSLHKKLIFIIPTMDCHTALVWFRAIQSVHKGYRA